MSTLMARLNIAHAAKAERQARIARSSSVGSLEARPVLDDFFGMASPFAPSLEGPEQASKGAGLFKSYNLIRCRRIPAAAASDVPGPAATLAACDELEERPGPVRMARA